MLFISHASEDNDITRWLALQLAKHGYGVWCDLTKLLGGETWPKEINIALEKRTCKFIFVLSRVSNRKPEPLNELQKARAIMSRAPLTDFIILLNIDGITDAELDYRLTNTFWIDFMSGWAGGLGRLKKLLLREKVPKRKKFGPAAVNLWWTDEQNRRLQVYDKESQYSSNRYQIVSLPEQLWYHVFEGRSEERRVGKECTG
jgi:hypothetical protein